MVVCPSCKDQVPHSAKACPQCGTRVIPADQLEDIPTKTTGWQKFVIIVSIILLILIAFTFYGAEDRENAAAQAAFTEPVMRIVNNTAAQTGYGSFFGMPSFKLDAGIKGAAVSVVFPTGPLSQEQAATFGQSVCAALAREYVRLGYAPRQITVNVGTVLADNTVYPYGQAVFNGNIGAIGWKPAQ